MDCDFLTIDKVLDSFYVVPDYQRDYVWQESHVLTLLEDIKSNIDFDPEDVESDPYFIGSIVVFSTPQKDGGKYLLIDGQQRMTTIFLLFCAIKARLKELNEDIPTTLFSDLRSVELDLDGKESSTYRIYLNHAKNQKLLEMAYRGELANASLPAPTNSEKNVISAFNNISEYLKDEYTTQGDELRKFAARIRLRVGLVRIKTDDLQKAMIVFETLNDRGVGLDAFDLLKNLLYSKIQGDLETQRLNEIWQEIKGNLDRKAIKPMRFLRYFIASIDDDPSGKTLTEKGAFNWFQEKSNRSKFKIDDNAIGFAKKIRKASGYYKDILFNNLDHHGRRSPSLESLNLLGGPSTRQHMGLLLTAIRKDCSSEQFDAIAACIESALFYSFCTKLRSQTLEAFIANWMVELRNIDKFDKFSVRAFASRVKSDLKEIYDQFYQNFETFGQRSVSQKYRQKYILAKFLQHSEKENLDFDCTYLSSILDQKVEIEHIHPQNPSEAASTEFGESDLEVIEECKTLFANLLLMEASLQKSCSNDSYQIKRPKYVSSKFWLVKKFADHSPDGTQKLKDSLSKWPTHSTWNQQELRSRQTVYKHISQSIWNFGL